MMASALLVHLSGGYVEAHFHFFVMLAVVAPYRDWVPFAMALLFIVIDHGVVGTLAPALTYNHPSAQHHPWIWALLHGVPIFAESAAVLFYWRAVERVERQKRQATLHELIEATPDALVVVDFGREFARGSVRRDQVDPALLGLVIEAVAVIGAIAIEMLEFGLQHVKVETELHIGLESGSILGPYVSSE
jgi:hypothetical protein